MISYWKGVFVYLSASLTLALQQELAALDCIHRSDSANMFIKDYAGYSYLYTVRNPLCPPCHFGSPVVRIRPIPFLSLAFLHLHNPDFMPLRFAFPHLFIPLFLSLPTIYPVADVFMIMSAILLAYFGLLRVSEFTFYPPSSSRKYVPLTRDDVKINNTNSLMEVHIRKSKTDQFAVGEKVVLASIGGSLCPVKAMIDFLHFRNYDKEPLYKFSSGLALQRIHIQRLFHSHISPVINLNTHSLRIGGATLLSLAGVPDSIIKKMGRWKSDCFKKYIRMSKQHVRSAFHYVRAFLDRTEI